LTRLEGESRPDKDVVLQRCERPLVTLVKRVFRQDAQINPGGRHVGEGVLEPAGQRGVAIALVRPVDRFNLAQPAARCDLQIDSGLVDDVVDQEERDASQEHAKQGATGRLATGDVRKEPWVTAGAVKLGEADIEGADGVVPQDAPLVHRLRGGRVPRGARS